MCVCLRVCVCVHACINECVRVCVCASACVCATRDITLRNRIITMLGFISRFKFKSENPAGVLTDPLSVTCSTLMAFHTHAV